MNSETEIFVSGQLPKDKRWGNKLVRAGMGGVAGQFASLAALPLVSRLYTQADIGVWAVWLGAAAILGNVAYLRYELAIVLARCDEEARDLAALCGSLLLAGVGVGLLACLLPAVRGFVGQRAGVPTWVPLALPLMSLGIGMMQIMQAWCVRLEWYGTQSAAQAAVAMLVPAGQVAGGWMGGGGVAWLVGGSLAGQWLATAALLAYVQWRPSPLFRAPRSIFALREVARVHKPFAYYSAPYTLFGVLRDRGSLFVLQTFISAAQVGQYAYVWRSLNFPVSLISGALRPVLFRDGAAGGVKNIEHDIRRILVVLALAATPWAVLFYVMPGEWLALAFGPEWEPAGAIGVWVVWIAFSYSFCNWLDRVMDVLRKQRLTMMMEVAFSSLALGGMYLAFRAGLGLRGALAAQAAVLVTYNLVYLVVVFRCAGYALRALAHVAALAVLTGAASAGMWVLCRWAWSPWTSVGVYAGVYAAAAALVAGRLLIHRRG